MEALFSSLFQVKPVGTRAMLSTCQRVSESELLPSGILAAAPGEQRLPPL